MCDANENVNDGSLLTLNAQTLIMESTAVVKATTLHDGFDLFSNKSTVVTSSRAVFASDGSRIDYLDDSEDNCSESSNTFDMKQQFAQDSHVELDPLATDEEDLYALLEMGAMGVSVAEVLPTIEPIPQEQELT